MIGFTHTANAIIHHTTYVAHPNAEAQAEAGSVHDHSYLQEVHHLRDRLTEIAPVPEEPQETIPSPLAQEAMNQSSAGEEALRITRRDRGYSIVTMAALNEDNRSVLQQVDLVVRNNDLYVLGFINGRPGHRVFHRMYEPPPYRYATADTSAIPLDLTIPDTIARNLNMSYDYPNLEQKANMRRYGGNFRSSIRTVRSAIATLAEHNAANDDEDSTSDVARALLRIIVTYFEGMRFHNLSQSIHDAGFDSGRTWTMTQDEALITNSWRPLSDFGSQMSLDSSSRESSPRLELSHSRNSPYGSRLYIASSMSDHGMDWRAVLAVALSSRWTLNRRGSCPSRIGHHRAPRDTNSIMSYFSDLADDFCSTMLVRVGNTYFDRTRGFGIISTILEDK
ncbi:hypothetical protein HEQ62_08065 [Haematospirillum jordaniae]|nr:ribosome-inactivating family protein [Haematospirillum jordaniae]NKD45662.1 hypothetical protein [Haematospirillum jordaniae]NKD57781.1 hypothetical protein [Haematospirillum jordaniae]NKD59733.1 hypothetical protein [Haematospirillum jordaniae]NKD67609.1 hypothetical protein [Haematospirillum jordaniae]NKD79644.1 hypothetical protein [Haematospirillum jordaniae]